MPGSVTCFKAIQKLHLQNPLHCGCKTSSTHQVPTKRFVPQSNFRQAVVFHPPQGLWVVGGGHPSSIQPVITNHFLFLFRSFSHSSFSFPFTSPSHRPLLL
ncbi:hypothetical protein DSO57_1027144 [Entomophthora muscae]|uniref:Uncharacterized protein n=1 Tax=Entomophthora muscae TaxID=34485 RepID=A0ACC2S3J3_9FUNG|nr:hypothetical protein DSO57_1027144 [Entomophthora muscae]